MPWSPGGGAVGSDEESTGLSRTVASTGTLKLAAIHTIDIFYTPIEERFERITRLATRVLDVPVAAVTLLSNQKQWFKSVSGWTVSELPLENSFCAVVAPENQVCVVSDTEADPPVCRSSARDEAAKVPVLCQLSVARHQWPGRRNVLRLRSKAQAVFEC